MRKQPFILNLTAAALLLLALPAAAEALSFGEITRQALVTYPAILSKVSSSAAATANLDAANWARYPTPSLEAGSDSNGVATAMLRVQQPIYSFGRITAGIDAAQSRREVAESAIKEARQDVALKVINAYVEALRQKERKEATAKEVGQLEALLGLITRRVEAQASPFIDSELARSRLYQARNDLSSIGQALASSLTKLSQLAGKPVDDVKLLDGDSSVEAKSREEALDLAREFSSTLQRLAREEAAAAADVDVKNASYKPQLSARYENANASAALNGTPAYSTKRLYLVLEMQTGAGLAALSEVRAAQARREAAQQEREIALRDLNERVSTDWDELAASRVRLENASLASVSAKQVYESYARLFTTGRKTWLDVLNTVRESTQSDLVAIDSQAQITGAALRLRLVTGKLKEMD